MPQLKLVVNSFPNGDHKLMVHQSSKGEIHLPHGGYDIRDKIVAHLNKVVPTDWKDEIEDLHTQERALIRKRQNLLAKYNREFKGTAKDIIQNIENTNPEWFI